MVNTSLVQLTWNQLRLECVGRGISVYASKEDLLLRLEQHNRETVRDPGNVWFYPDRPSVTELTGGVDGLHASPVREVAATSELYRTPSEDSVPSPSGGRTPAAGQPPLRSHLQSTENRAGSASVLNDDNNTVYKTAVEQLTTSTPKLRQHSNDTKTFEFETCLLALETTVSEITTERRTATSQQPPRSDVPRPENPPSPAHATSLDSYRPPRSYFTPHESLDDRVGLQTGNASRYTPYATSVQEQRSVLIPYQNLLLARTWLPEFTGTWVENPVRFLDDAESILKQARIHPSGWCKTVEPQFKGVASTWCNNIKTLHLSWDEFRVEFLDHFDNPQIRSKLYVDLISIRQTSKQSLTEFVLIKNQLACRVNSLQSESDLVSIVAGLTYNTFRMHILLHRPLTFSELRRIAYVLDPVMDVINPPVKQRTSKPKRGAANNPQKPPMSK